MGDGLQRESIQSYGSQNHNGEANLPRRVGVAWAMAFLSLWCSASAHAADPGGTPAGLVQAQLAAAQRQDVDGFLAGLTSASRQALREATARQAAMREAQKELRAVLDQKFGAGGATLADPPDDLRTALSRLAAAEIVGQSKKPDGSVELRVRTSIKGNDGKIVGRDDVLVLRQENGAWKLVLGFTDGAAATRAIAAIRRTTERVRRGELKDRVSALIALDNGLSEKAGVSP